MTYATNAKDVSRLRSEEINCCDGFIKLTGAISSNMFLILRLILISCFQGYPNVLARPDWASLPGL